MVCPGRGVSYVCLRNRCLDTGVLHVVTHASESVSPPVVGMRFGYTRVSTVAQTLHQQHDALKAAGASKIYSDTMSGARDDRPGLAALMDQLRAGDTVVVWKLDRLGRNMLHILETVKALTEMGVTLVSTSDGIDSSTAAGRMMIGVLGSLRRVRARVGQGANSPEASGVSRQRHQVRTAPQGRRRRPHRHRQADEGRRPHRQGHRQVPRCGTLMHLQGVPIVVVSAWLGHADPAFTMRTYVHSQNDALKTAAVSSQPNCVTAGVNEGRKNRTCLSPASGKHAFRR